MSCTKTKKRLLKISDREQWPGMLYPYCTASAYRLQYPPRGEIEACLFALQASVGGILFGGVFGYWFGQARGKNVS